MHINNSNLSALNIGFKALFQNAFQGAKTDWQQVATLSPSTTAVEQYPWLGQIPGMREWIGDRVVHAVDTHGYSIKNITFESTVSVPREKIEDDQYGVYNPMFQELGRAAASHPDTLVIGETLKEGFTRLCYDGQPFFHTDHPVLDKDGNTVSVSNTGGGSGTPWFVMDTSRAIKPLILQIRRPAQFVAKTSLNDDNVFERKTFVWGVDGRWNAGYGFWQMAYGSKQELNETNLAAAIAAIGSCKGDYGRPLGLRATLLVVPPALEFVASKLIVAKTVANGGENVLANRLELLVSPWLA
jgi:phage major head subunit gpT-like protein